MKLFHASKEAIEDPDVFYGRKNADFGQGFYLSNDKEFSRRWIVNGGVVNEYEFDPTGLKIKQFKRDREWFEYIFENRRAHDTSDADVVIGPIANDTIYDTLGVISSGFLEPDDALKLLLIGPEYTQIALKSLKARERLKWIGLSEPVDSEKYRAILKKEEEDFQQLFSQELSRL